MSSITGFRLSIALLTCALVTSVFATTPDSLPPSLRDQLTAYNVRWDSPSLDSMDSMPLSGRHGAGANVWVQDGSIWLYLGHSAAFDENSALLKLGCIRVTPEGALLADPASFQQELDLPTGSIRISVKSKEGVPFAARLWFANETLIVETTCGKAASLEIAYGTWRDVTRKKINSLGEARADDVEMDESGLMFSHSNAKYPSALSGELKKQPFATGTIHNPSDHNVFGGALASSQKLTPSEARQPVQWQAWNGASWHLKTAPETSQTLAIALRAQKNGTPKTWLAEARSLLETTKLEAARVAEQQAWTEFWSRSHIFINPGSNPEDPAWQVGKNYQLFRYMLACNRGGALPLLFNGGIFTADFFSNKIYDNNQAGDLKPTKKLSMSGTGTPDYRRWLYCYFMSQNQRWLGWPTILAGDTDLLTPSVAFYRDRAATAAARAKGLGAQGVVYPEPIKVWGLSAVSPRADGLCGASHLTFAMAMMLEHAWMALHAHSTLGLDIKKDLPWIEGTVRFYDSYYRNANSKTTGSELDEKGKLVIFPANSIELAINAKNPVEVVAGLRRVTDALLKLPKGMLSEDERNYFTDVRKRLPELPVGQKEGRPILHIADSYEKLYNRWELPELYAVWPYRLVGTTVPGTVELGRATWDLLPPDRTVKCKKDYSWMPVIVNMAGLGNTTEAKTRVLEKLSDQKAQLQFPAFFGPGHDWIPDHNWGGSAMTGLQEMLLAADPYGDGKIHLLPAWPKEWNVDFKLHAPQQTTVEASVKGGKIVSLKITPETRRKDLIIDPAFL